MREVDESVEEGIHLKDYLHMLNKRKWLLLIVRGCFTWRPSAPSASGRSTRPRRRS